MDHLVETIAILTDEERREFRAFIQRRRSKKERKDLELFDILASQDELKPREIAGKLYGKPMLNAYHTLRKRLVKELLDFTMLKSMDEDNTSYSTLLGMLAMARRLIDKNRADIARRYLDKAEQLALQTETFDLLDNIYNLKIRYAHELDMDVTQIISSAQKYREEAEVEEKVNMAYGLIRQRLNEIRLTGETRSLSSLMTSVLREINLDEDRIVSPSLMFLLVSMTRSAVIATKNYHLFDPYVTAIYDRLVQAEAFSKKDHLHHLWFLYMIAHVKYRNRDFEAARKYVDELTERVSDFNKLHYNRFYPRVVMLDAAVYSYMQENEEAIRILQNALGDDRLNLSVEDKCNMTLNLAVYHFQAEDFRSANRVLRDMGHSDKWLENRMGVEWRFKKNLIEIIVQVEMGNSEIALSRIASMDRYFSGFFENEMYQRARIFLGLIKHVIEKPESVTTEAFSKKVDDTIIRLPGHREDIQAMTFYCWLKSKMQRRPYYPVLVETVRSFGKEHPSE
ncbi:MAG: hypothetical protein KDC12_04580 [Flavobacteriales bacterium]|nr:hypothetical protein [Flavobacteriales bacterium]